MVVAFFELSRGRKGLELKGISSFSGYLTNRMEEMMIKDEGSWCSVMYIMTYSSYHIVNQRTFSISVKFRHPILAMFFSFNSIKE